MKKMNIIRLICLSCFMYMASSAASAQDLKSILSGVANAVANKVTNSSGVSLEGTWKYTGPDCKFESDNFLAQAGGELASKKVEEKMSDVLTKLGFTDGCTYVFNADSTYTSTVKGRTTSGTYSYNADTKELTMKTKLGIKFTAIVSQQVLSSNKMSLLFKADKLMSLAQTIGGALGNTNSTISAATSLLNQYEGLQLGFELEKQ